MKRAKVLFIIMLVLAVFYSCKDDNVSPQPETRYGPLKPVGKGTARSFVTYNSSNEPASIGFILTEDALNNLPTEVGPHGELFTSYSYPLDFPAKTSSTNFNHVQTGWNPYGHEPPHIYSFPHFDFHFYMITKEEQMQITPYNNGTDTLYPAPKYIPQDYSPGPKQSIVPMMGVHWVDTKAPEFKKGEHFTATFVYGYYKGQMAFLEPMITKPFLETHPDFTLQIKQPQAWQRSGYYPMQMHVWYDANKKEYVIALEGLTWRDKN